MAAHAVQHGLAIRDGGSPFSPSSSAPTIAIAPTQNSREEATKPSTNFPSSPPAKRPAPAPKPLSRVSISSASPIDAPSNHAQHQQHGVLVTIEPSAMVSRPLTAPPMPMKNAVHRPSACMMSGFKPAWQAVPWRKTPRRSRRR